MQPRGASDAVRTRGLPTRAAAKTASLPVWGWLERISWRVSTRDFLGLRLALALNTRAARRLRPAQ